MIHLQQEAPRIVVVGSSSIDLVINAPKIPQPNETMIAQSSERFFGGKGANQAVACAKLGAVVHFISCVGLEPAGQQILRHLVEEGVNVGFVSESEENETGRAYIYAAENKNTILVVPSANYDLKPKHINNAKEHIEKANLVLFQLENPMETIEHGINLAHQLGVKVGLYASPAVPLPKNWLEKIHFIIAKENDVKTLFKNENKEEVMKTFANKLFLRSDNNTTEYSNGETLISIAKKHEHTPHTMGMGDAFTAGFAVAFCHNNPIEKCVEFGNEISHRVSLERGSQRGLPLLKEVL